MSVPLFTVRFGEMVLVRDIGFFSFCEHERLPFWGRIHVAYLPGDKEIRPGDIPTIVNVLARRLQVQERLTREVATAISDAIDPRGVAVMCEASHLGMMRGMDKRQPATVTSAMLGAFRDNKATRGEFLSLVGWGQR